MWLRRVLRILPAGGEAFSSKSAVRRSSDTAATSNAIATLVAAAGGGGVGISSLEADLDRLDPPLSDAVVSDTLRALTERGVPACRFFAWLSQHRGVSPSARAHNLLVENAGRLADYPAMARALARVSERRLSLTEQAFAFLRASSSGSSVDGAAKATLQTLDATGGPCRASGVFSLVKALASAGEFDAAVWVIEETARRASYYNVLLAAKCRAGDFQGAREVFDEMRKGKCDPNSNSWNYLLGCLLKNGRATEACDLVEAMERPEHDGVPNSLTYEILACHACKAGKMDSARRILDQMFLEKLTPRITIHTAFIKGYFCTGRMEDACEYVRAMSTRDRCSVNRNYSLLAKLFRKSGRTVEAGRVLYELMMMGLRPDHSSYVKVAKDLHKMGRGDLAAELKTLYQGFVVQTGLER
ncbi:pentatricopeptide repeat-containing protein At5g61990, mitochondrial-like [Lolium rigidum]|nr:pentatricopeptide repeat-containing protein At5g61990, mitochondrial-like [Lolium rigidum]